MTIPAGTVDLIHGGPFVARAIDNDEMEASFSKETDCAPLHG